MSKKTRRPILREQARETICKVYDFMKKEALANYAEKLTDARWRTSQAVGVSEKTVTRILAERRVRNNTNKPTTVDAEESNTTEEAEALEAIFLTEVILEENADSVSETSTSHSNSTDTNAAIITPPIKKRRVKTQPIKIETITGSP